MIIERLSVGDVVRIYNAIAVSKDQKTVSKFKDKASGVKRLQGISRGIARPNMISHLRSACIAEDIIELLPTVASPVSTPEAPPAVEEKPAPAPVTSKVKTLTGRGAKVKLNPTPEPEPVKIQSKLIILQAVRTLIPVGAKGEAATVTSTNVARHLKTSILTAIKMLKQLAKQKLVRLEDDSPDDKNPLYYVSLTQAGIKKALPEVAVPKKKLPSAAPGPNSKHGDKKLYRCAEWKKTNPRREGTHGHKSFSLIKDGMTHEQYIAAGGRNNDLQWDIDHGYVEVK